MKGLSPRIESPVGSGGGRRYGFRKPSLIRLFSLLDACGWAIARLFGPPSPRRTPRRILLVNLAHIGDVLMTTPAIAAIRAAHRDAHLAMLAGPWSAAVLENNPHLDEILVTRASWWDRDRGSPWCIPGEFLEFVEVLRSGRFDAVVNFKSFFQENLAAALAGIPSRIGYGIYGGGFLHTSCVDFPWDAHTVEEHLALAALLGGSAAHPVVEVFPSREDERVVEDWLGNPPRALVAMHLGAGAPAKRWPVEGFAAVARLVRERLESDIVLVGGVPDAPWGEEFRRRVGFPVLDGVGRFGIRQTAALLTRCRAFVGNDSGPAHLAAAVGCPAVVVFSGTNDVHRWRPWGRNVRTIQKTPECAPCGLDLCARTDHACLSEITPQEVFDELQGLLAAR